MNAGRSGATVSRSSGSLHAHRRTLGWGRLDVGGAPVDTFALAPLKGQILAECTRRCVPKGLHCARGRIASLDAVAQKGYSSSMYPRFRAIVTAWVRSFAPSFRRMF
jgi:hypothetical protein